MAWRIDIRSTCRDTPDCWESIQCHGDQAERRRDAVQSTFWWHLGIDRPTWGRFWRWLQREIEGGKVKRVNSKLACTMKNRHRSSPAQYHSITLNCFLSREPHGETGLNSWENTRVMYIMWELIENKKFFVFIFAMFISLRDLKRGARWVWRHLKGHEVTLDDDAEMIEWS